MPSGEAFSDPDDDGDDDEVEGELRNRHLIAHAAALGCFDAVNGFHANGKALLCLSGIQAYLDRLAQHVSSPALGLLGSHQR